MRFTEQPQRLRVFILATLLLLAPVGLILWHQPRPSNLPLLGALLFFATLFSTWKVELTVLQGKMTVTFAVVCLALLLQDTQAAVLCAALGALTGTYLRPARTRWRVEIVRPPCHQGAFNIANCAISCTVSALVYKLVQSQLAPGDLGRVMALSAFTGSYFLLNTLSVSLAIALQRRLSWASVWQQNFLWTAPGYFASASMAAVVQALSPRVGVWSLLFMPWLYVIYYSYKLYMDRLHQDMSHIQELNKLNQAIISSLATAIDAKDRYTCSHINRVHRYALTLAEAAGLKGPELEAVSTGALVHDIGKLGIPDHILGKPGKLSQEEFTRIQSHVQIGADILSPIPFPFPVVDVVLTHHERWDGLGYPRGLRGQEIPIGGRIISLVDVFDALTSNRPYRRAMTVPEAVAVLRDAAGKQFDPTLVELFTQILPRVMREIEEEEAEARARHDADSDVEEGASALVRISQAAAEMAAVCDVAHFLAEQESQEEIFSVVVNRALALLPADTAVLYLRTQAEPVLLAVQAAGRYQERLEGMTIQIGEGVAGWVAENQQPKVNVSATLDVARRFGPEENLELSDSIAVPLVHGPETLGVLSVYTMGYGVLSEHHLHVLNILAEHAAAALQNIRRVERHRELAFTDPLTGLANSRCLVRHLERLSHARATVAGVLEPPYSILMLDLDGFKEVNDRLGHLRGDELLRMVGSTLTALARPDDLVCRYAGDEFVIVLPGAVRGQAEAISVRVREAIDGLGPVDGQVRIGASVGVATCPDDGLDGRTLINIADRRMYEDKFERRRRRQGPGGGRRSGPISGEMVGAGRG